jgi:hypothetical protein
LTLVRPGGTEVLTQAVRRQVLRASGLMAVEDPFLHG